MENRLTRTRLRRRITAFAPGILLLVLAILLGIGFRQTQRTREQVGRFREAALAAERVFSDLRDVETGQRGYLLTGDERYLAPYTAARARLNTNLQVLRDLIRTQPAELERFAKLSGLIRERLVPVEQSIALQRAGRHEAATDVVRSGVGIRYMTEIRRVMGEMIRQEQANTRAAFAAENRYIRFMAALFVIGVALLFLLGYAVNVALLRFATARAAAAEQIRRQNEELQQQASEIEAQRDHLQEQNMEMELQQEQLQQQAVELEAQHEELVARARELEALNTDLRESNAALEIARVEAEQANRAKSNFLAAMSHELRTPLNAIGGYIDLVEAGVYGDVNDGQLDAMKRVKSNQQHLLSIISDIMSYAGIAAGNMKVRTEPVALRPLVQEIERIMHPAAREKDLALLIEEPATADTVVASADPARLRQILVNCLSNAVKFTPAGGTITLTYCANGNHAEIEVRDTGPGIPADKLEAIFEPFVQLDRSGHEADGRGGLGLGLALSRELARGMDGDVLVQSRLGAGSAFTVRLPLVASVPAGALVNGVGTLSSE